MAIENPTRSFLLNEIKRYKNLYEYWKKAWAEKDKELRELREKLEKEEK